MSRHQGIKAYVGADDNVDCSKFCILENRPIDITVYYNECVVGLLCMMLALFVGIDLLFYIAMNWCKRLSLATKTVLPKGTYK